MPEAVFNRLVERIGGDDRAAQERDGDDVLLALDGENPRLLLQRHHLQDVRQLEVAQIANECAAYIGADVRLSRGDISVVRGYMGQGYGVVGDLEREAIRLMARCEGIVLDPVYAGRAFGALVDLIRKGRFRREETVLFWHTGGAPALFAYARELLQR